MTEDSNMQEYQISMLIEKYGDTLVTFQCGSETNIKTCLSTLLPHPNSHLLRIVLQNIENQNEFGETTVANETGQIVVTPIFLDHSAKRFERLLDYLRDGGFKPSSSENEFNTAKLAYLERDIEKFGPFDFKGEEFEGIDGIEGELMEEDLISDKSVNDNLM